MDEMSQIRLCIFLQQCFISGAGSVFAKQLVQSLSGRFRFNFLCLRSYRCQKSDYFCCQDGEFFNKLGQVVKSSG